MSMAEQEKTHTYTIILLSIHTLAHSHTGRVQRKVSDFREKKQLLRDVDNNDDGADGQQRYG